LSNGSSITGISKAIVIFFLLICNLNIVIIVVSSNNLSTLGQIMVTYFTGITDNFGATILFHFIDINYLSELSNLFSSFLMEIDFHNFTIVFMHN